MAITTQERTNILKLTVGLFNAAPGANYLSEFTSVFEANGHNLAALAGTLGTTGAFQSLYPNFQTASEFATKFLTTLGLQGNTEAVDFVTAKFNAGVPKAQIIYDAVVALDASTSAEFAAAKAILVNKAAVAENYSVTLGASSTSLEALQGALANVTADPASVTAANAANAGGNGQTFTLTADFDNLTGTAGNDTFNGIAGQTISVGDAINGGGGVDTLNVLVTTATGSTEVFDLVDVDTIAVRNLSGSAQTLSAANWTGYTTLVNDRSTASSDVAFTSVGVNAAVALASSASSTSLTYAADVFKGAADSVSVTASGVTAGTLTLTTAAAAEKIETINLTSNGTANTITDIVATNGADKLVIAGAGNLTLSNDVGIATIDASAATGKVSLKATGTYAATNPASVDVVDLTITTGAGNDTIDVAGVAEGSEIAINAGAGDDKVVIDAAKAYSKATATNAGDVINGGDGQDTLSVNGDLSADLTGIVSGFEILEVTADATQAMATNKLGISKFVVSGADTDLTVTGAAADSSVTIKDYNTNLAVTIGTDTTADTLSVTLESNLSTGTDGSGITATSYETLNIASSKAATDTGTITNDVNAITATSATKLNLSGSTNLNIDVATLKADAAIDASAFTGELTIAELGANVKTYTGGSGKDTVTLVAGGLKQGNTFAGGEGTDKLSVTASASQNTGILAVSGFETISITGNDDSRDTVTADFRNVTGLTKLELDSGSGDTDNFVINRLASGVTVQVNSELTGLTLTNESGTTQTVALGAAVGTLSVDAAATTLNISNVADGGNALTTLAGSSLTSIVVTEKADTTGVLNLGSALSTVTSIDASALVTSQVNADLGAAGTAVGGKLGDDLTGSAGKDTITGGEGNDTISGGNATDVIVFGTEKTNGADVLTIKAGAINTGTVANDGDILNFAAFLAGGSVDQNGGTGNTITAYTTSSVGDVNITNKVALITGTETAVDEAAEIAALINGSGDAFSITAGGKAVVISGVASPTNGDSNEYGRIFFVSDANGDGTVADAEVTLVGTTQADFAIGGFVATNFAFA